MSNRMAEPTTDYHVAAIIKGTEKYVFLWVDSQRPEVLRTLGRFASDPDLSFTWHDAACLSLKIREDQPAG